MRPEPNQHQDTTIALRTAQRTRVITLGRQAVHILKTLTPREDQPQQTPGPREAAMDLADYLDGTRQAPEHNQSNIPHARDWQLDHALHLIRDVAQAVNDPSATIPPTLSLITMQELLDLTIEAALLSHHPDNRPLLDRLVQGDLPGPDAQP